MKKILFIMFVFSLNYLLASTSGGGLPWEGPLETIKSSITGPVAFTISILGIVGTGSALIWGGEISGFMKSMIYVVLVIAVIILANNFIGMFGGSGALI